jgi:hypothetical protein
VCKVEGEKIRRLGKEYKDTGAALHSPGNLPERSGIYIYICRRLTLLVGTISDKGKHHVMFDPRAVAATTGMRDVRKGNN